MNIGSAGQTVTTVNGGGAGIVFTINGGTVTLSTLGVTNGLEH